MKRIFYQISGIPDLSLAKYNTGGMQGMDSAFAFHRTFLQQMHQKGLTAGISLHLYYQYCPEESKGRKLRVFIEISGPDEAFFNVEAIMAKVSLARMFQWKRVSAGTPDQQYAVFTGSAAGDTDSSDARVFKDFCSKTYDHCVMLSKKELFYQPTNDRTAPPYYTVGEWKPADEGRLNGLFHLMEGLDRDTLFRVDLYPVDMSTMLQNMLEQPMIFLKSRESVSYGGVQKDYNISRILDSYKDLEKELLAAPRFMMNVFAFAAGAERNNDSAEMLLAAAASESVESGVYTLTTIAGNTNPAAGGMAVYGAAPAPVSRKFTPFSFNGESFVPVRGVRSGGEKWALAFTGRECRLSDDRCPNENLRMLPVLFTLDQAEPFFRLPLVDEDDVIEIPKETAPPSYPGEGALFLGEDDFGYRVNFPKKNLAKHAFIAGVPGSGKTNLMHHLASSLWLDRNDRIPFLVLEPAKKEYRALLNQPGMEDVYLFSPNALMTFPLHVNPFEMPKGVTVSEHIGLLMKVFKGAFPMENPAPFLLDTSIEAVYRDCGWMPDMINTGNGSRAFPTVSMLYKKLEQEIAETDYSDENRGNLKAFLQVRIGSLLKREMGDIFDVPTSTFAPEEWLDKCAIVELEAMESGTANFMTLLLCALIRESLKVNPHYGKNHARHVIFIEEAHNIIGPTAVPKDGSEGDAKQASTEFIVNMLAEVRALKEGIIIADQLPTVMAPEVIKNTGLKIGLRITSADDRTLLCQTMSANAAQMDEMGSFNVGRALISYEGLKKPFALQIHEWLGPGDNAFIRDKTQREEVQTSKDDDELFEEIKSRASYMDMAERSFKIEANKLVGKTKIFKDRAEAAAAFLRSLLRAEVQLAEVPLQLERSMEEGASSGRPDIYDKALSDAEELNRLIESYRQDEKYAGSSAVFKEGLRLFSELEKRQEHWKKIGFNSWKNSSENRTKILVIKKCIAQQLYEIYRISKQLRNYELFSDELIARYESALRKPELKAFSEIAAAQVKQKTGTR